MLRQYHITLPPHPRGFHLITDFILDQLDDLPETGLCHLFLRHSSAGLTINENADSTVRSDMENFMNHLVPEDIAYFEHTYEGPDDMPAHVKSTLFGVSLQIPICHGKLALGTWQGIYLCEFRSHPSRRKLIATVYF